MFELYDSNVVYLTQGAMVNSKQQPTIWHREKLAPSIQLIIKEDLQSSDIHAKRIIIRDQKSRRNMMTIHGYLGSLSDCIKVGRDTYHRDIQRTQRSKQTHQEVQR
jgi:hypothetical protein